MLAAPAHTGANGRVVRVLVSCSCSVTRPAYVPGADDDRSDGSLQERQRSRPGHVVVAGWVARSVEDLHRDGDARRSQTLLHDLELLDRNHRLDRAVHEEGGRVTGVDEGH